MNVPSRNQRHLIPHRALVLTHTVKFVVSSWNKRMVRLLGEDPRICGAWMVWTVLERLHKLVMALARCTW